MVRRSPKIPFPVKRHPDIDEIESHTLAWAARFGLVSSEEAKQRLAASRFGEYAAFTYPDAPWPEAGIAGDWLTWAFLIDDQYEDRNLVTEEDWREIVAATGDVLSGRPPRFEAPLIAALADLTGRLYTLSSPAWRKRFTEHFTAMITGASREIRLRDTGVPPTKAEYVELRRDVGAMRVVFDTMEICVRTELGDESYRYPAYQEIVTAGADIVTWTNDLHSVTKEVEAGMVTNMVLVLSHHENLTLAEAADATVDLIEGRVSDLRAAMSLLHDDRTLRCARAVCDWVAGSDHWHLSRTERYGASGR
ncbi:hypothetical protein AB5J62_17990 [Amycolatopsis sp. cg5]|uniref:terpene synthase family protein n=1 Tax=Amycolatopsis sp. cg5 TaxID=3238802 RepID=UPI003524AEFE